MKIVYRLVLLACLFLGRIEAHDFKVGDIWYYNADEYSLKLNIVKLTEKDVFFIGKHRNKDLDLRFSFKTDKTLESNIKGNKNCIFDFISKEYISPSCNATLSKNKIKLNELYINDFLTIQRGTELYFPIPKDLKYLRKNYDLMKFKFEYCKKLQGNCTAFIDFGDDRLVLTIYTPTIDVHNQYEKGFVLSLDIVSDNSDFRISDYYYDVGRYLYGTQYDNYFFTNANVKQKGRIFTSYVTRNSAEFVWFDLDKDEIIELISKNKKYGTGNRIIKQILPSTKYSKVLFE